MNPDRTAGVQRYVTNLAALATDVQVLDAPPLLDVLHPQLRSLLAT
ncbi:Uncharacterised protein [Pseudomonas fluorescens]|uniref:Uncharacterized protein n=1 Tax=Pseudomonas fluorescens TaxID=294 RepID=A0A379ID31_PSEFL|nr:Uncharacterised protein [Pseudomonas fluorescens]